MIPDIFVPILRRVRDAIVAEDTAYWQRPANPANASPVWVAGVDVAERKRDGATLIVAWSQEYSVGPRDYDDDARERMDDIARRIGVGVTVHVGETAGTLQAHIPVPTTL